MADALLRAEKVVKNNETLGISYEKDFKVYDKIARANIPNRLIDSRHVGYRELPRPDGQAKKVSYGIQPGQDSPFLQPI